MSRKILLIEDDAEERAAHLATLAAHYDVMVAEDCASALTALKHGMAEIKCVLLSLACEGAFDFLATKRVNMLLHGVPVVAIAQRDADDQELRALSLDATDVTFRPIKPEMLLQRVRNLLKLSENIALRRALERDPLTGIFNRDTFVRRTARMLRKKAVEIYHLQVWDVEHFKVINDLFGMGTGDKVLCAIAHYLNEQLRGAGTYARLESDRFALCYPARLFEARSLVDGINQHLEEMSMGIRMVVYAGVYQVDDAAITVDQMCDRAFMAIKTIKGSYHERFAYYDSAMRERLMVEQRVTNEMNTALAQKQFCFYLQPIYNITTGEPSSAEALVRWEHPTRGLIPPMEFIPLFERNGFITKLDAYLMESVCQYQSDLLSRGIKPLPISVNLSRLNLLNPALAQDITDTVERFKLPHQYIKFEITESAYTDHPEQLLSAVEKLQQKGFAILMDDFGSGYSSLSMLKELPVDILKVDMQFLVDMESNGRAANVMASIIRMAKWLGIVVVAEGVETHAQVSFLRSMGCDEAQGYLLAKPMPAEAFTTLLENPAAMRRQQESNREKILSDYDLQSLWEGNQHVNILFSGMIGAIGLYEKTGDSLEALRVNEGFFELMGSTPQSLLERDHNAFSRMEPIDFQKLLNACDRAAQTHAIEQVQVRCPHAHGHILWLDIKIRHLGSVNKQELFYFALTDITRQKELERNYQLFQYGAVLLDAYYHVLEINYTDNIATSFDAVGDEQYHTITKPLESTVRSLLEQNTHPEDRERFAEALRRENIEKSFANTERRAILLDLRTKGRDDAFHWTRVTIFRMEDPAGKLRTLFCSRHIDEQKKNEQMQAEYLMLQAKQQEQERYRTILEQTQTALLAWAPEAACAEGNALAGSYRLSKVSFRALVTANLPPDVCEPQDLAALRAFLKGMEKHKGASRLIRLTLTNGETRWCKLSITVQRAQEGDITAVLAIINDVDHEHRIQLQLDAQRLQNERRLSMLSHLYWTLPCCILQMNLEDPPKPVFYNRACWELFGFHTKEAFDEVASRDLFSLIVPEDRETFLAQLKRCREKRMVENIEVTVARPGGEWGSLRGSVAISHGSDGQPLLQLVLLDTTLQREQELRLTRTKATLERTTDMLQHLLENLPVGVTLFEFGSLVRALYINTRAYSMFGLKDHQPERFMELMRLSAFHLHCELEGKPIEVIDDNGADLGSVVRLTRDDGLPFWLRTYYTIVPQNNSPPLCYAVLVDVSNQVQMERAYNRQSELYRIMMEDSQQIFFDYDLEKDVIHYTLRLPSGEREERTVQTYSKSLRHSLIIHPDYTGGLLNALKRYCRTRQPGTYEYLADYYHTGEFRWYRAYFRTIADESGFLYRMVGRVVDIQEEKQREAQLGQAKVFRRAVNQVSLFVFAFELPEMAPHLLSCEEVRRSGFHAYLDYLAQDRNETLIHPEERGALLDAIDPQNLVARYRAGEREFTVPFRALNRKKNWVWLEMNIHLSAGEGKNNVGGIGYVRVIDAQKKLERKACFDGLTQLLNRATVEERIEHALVEGEVPSCLLILDVDNFKSVNDLFGHRAGDELLSKLAGTLRARLRQSDLVGRLGGDEFVALLKGATEQVARDKGTELLAAIEALTFTLPHASPVTISIGYACAPQDGMTFAELYAKADQALYTAKRCGKNRCCSPRDLDEP